MSRNPTILGRNDALSRSLFDTTGSHFLAGKTFPLTDQDSRGQKSSWPFVEKASKGLLPFLFSRLGSLLQLFFTWHRAPFVSFQKNHGLYFRGHKTRKVNQQRLRKTGPRTVFLCVCPFQEIRQLLESILFITIAHWAKLHKKFH